MGNTKRSKHKYRIGDIIEDWSYYTYRDNTVAEYIEHLLIVGITRTYVDWNKPRLYYELMSLKTGAIYPTGTRLVDMKIASAGSNTGGYRKVA